MSKKTQTPVQDVPKQDPHNQALSLLQRKADVLSALLRRSDYLQKTIIEATKDLRRNNLEIEFLKAEITATSKD